MFSYNQKYKIKIISNMIMWTVHCILFCICRIEC